MRGLALDLGKRTGWAADARPANTGAYPLEPITGTWELFHDFEDGLLDLENRIYRIWDELRFDYLAYEAPIIFMRRGGHTSHSAMDQQKARAIIACLAGKRLGLHTFDFVAATARKFMCGSGRAKKQDVMWRCQTLRWRVDTPDAADAVAGLVYCRGCMGSADLLIKAERK